MGMPPKKVAAPKYWALYVPGDGYGIFCAGVYARATAQREREGDGRLTKSSKASTPGIKLRSSDDVHCYMHVPDAPVQHIDADVWYSFVDGPRTAGSALHGQAGQLNLVHGPPSERPAGGVPVLPSECWEPLMVPSPAQQHVCSMRAPHIPPTSRGGEQASPDALAMGSKSGAPPSSNDLPDASSPAVFAPDGRARSLLAAVVSYAATWLGSTVLSQHHMLPSWFGHGSTRPMEQARAGTTPSLKTSPCYRSLTVIQRLRSSSPKRRVHEQLPQSN